MKSFILLITELILTSFRSLSAILVADFTLDLRQSNVPAIQANDLPAIRSVRDLGQHIHRSFLVEMDYNQSIDTDDSDDVHELGDMDVPVPVAQDRVGVSV